MHDDSAWDRYDAWNRALAEVIFTPANAGRPVYLDMDEDVLAQVAEAAGTEPAHVVDDLAAAVCGTLNLNAVRGSVLAQQLEQLSQWRIKLREENVETHAPGPPPVLALLAVLTIAAEQMGRDENFGANAYYPRLYQLLKLEDASQQRRLHTSYMREAETLWRSLNEWLVAADGQFGLPSAYALNRRYIGLPMSQALVRSADRQHFPQMFSKFGLPPGTEVSSSDMELMLDSWIRQVPCPVSRSLESLWERGLARERIASVAAVELRSWDGSVDSLDEDDAGALRKVLLLCQLRRFPRTRLEISFVADLKPLPTPQALMIRSADGAPSIDVVPVAGGRVEPTWSSKIDPGSLVEGVLELGDPASGRHVRRWPRRVVPLRRDELLNAFVECERVQLGEDAMLLVKDDRGLPQEANRLLTEIARPGFRQEEELPGLPDNWVLFSDVQIMASPSSEPRSDLNALVPILSSQLALAGGLKLPGRVRKWSSLDPPEVRAIVQDADSVSIEMTPLDDQDGAPGQPTTWTSQSSTLVVDLAALNLRDGDYELSLKNGNTIVQQTVLRLRSSSSPDTFTWRTATPLGHDLVEDPLAAMRAVPITDPPPAVLVRGAYATPGNCPRTVPAAAPRSVSWSQTRRPVAPVPAITVARPDPASCVATGAHRIVLPTYYGQPTSTMISGTCSECGLVKRYPGRYSARRFQEWSRASQTAEVADVSQLPPIQHRDADWETAFDSLVHVGGGGTALLERIALQIESTKLFVDEFSRGLEVHGDVEFHRRLDMTTDEWELSPAYLAELPGGGFVLTGRWTGANRVRLHDLVREAGGSIKAGGDESGYPVEVVDAVPLDELTRLVKSAGGVGVVQEAAARLLGVLPKLSSVEAALPRIPMPGARRILQFDVSSASWGSVESAAYPGAYRLESAFTSTDVFRSADDISRGMAALGTVQLVKHIAARHAGHPLLAYRDSHDTLAVPLGADLPVLYGRAAVLCSGRLPLPVREQRQLVYHDVPPAIADGLAALLTS